MLIPPELDRKDFHCPHCRIHAAQGWYSPSVHPRFTTHQKDYAASPSLKISVCAQCEKLCVWHNSKLVSPLASVVPDANSDLPPDIASDYDEASAILSKSPRGAAALLRLALQKLCVHLGTPGKNINDDIRVLVERGLPKPIQQAMDVVRVVGNNAVHPGQIDLQDDPSIAMQLFSLVNVVADVMITQPHKIATLYEGIVPPAQREAISRRDGLV